MALSGRSRRRWLLPAIGALVAQAATIVWLTWPFAARAATHLPAFFGRAATECLLLAWALAHESRALFGQPWVFPHGNAFYPESHALFYGEAGFGAVPLFAPIFLATGNPTLALNFMLLAGVLLTTTALHLVITRWTGSWTAGLVGGWFFLTQHWVLWTWIAHAPNYAVLPYLPLIMWLAAKPLAGVAGVLGLAALVALQGLTSVYVAAATLLPLGILALVRLARGATRASGLRLLAVLGLALLTLVPAYSGYLVVRAQNPQLREQTVYRVVRMGAVALPWGPFAGGEPMALPPLAVLLIGIGLGHRLLRRHDPGRPGTPSAWWNGALWAAVGLVASLTPVAIWHGRRVNLPHAWLAAWLPVYDVLRAPNRLGVAGLMGLTVLTGTAFAECLHPFRRVHSIAMRGVLTAGLASLVGAGLYVHYAAGVDALGFVPGAALPREYPLARPPELAPPLAEILAARPGPLLEAPVGPGTQPHAEAMYRSIFHRRPLLNGYDGYWPAGFPMRMQLACRLPDLDALLELHLVAGVETILVHLRALDDAGPAPPPYGCPPDMPRSDAWLAAGTSAGSHLRLLARHGDDLLFAAGPLAR